MTADLSNLFVIGWTLFNFIILGLIVFLLLFIPIKLHRIEKRMAVLESVIKFGEEKPRF